MESGSSLRSTREHVVSPKVRLPARHIAPNLSHQMSEFGRKRTYSFARTRRQKLPLESAAQYYVQGHHPRSYRGAQKEPATMGLHEL